MNIKNKANLTFQSPTTTYRNYDYGIMSESYHLERSHDKLN